MKIFISKRMTNLLAVILVSCIYFLLNFHKNQHDISTLTIRNNFRSQEQSLLHKTLFLTARNKSAYTGLRVVVSFTSFSSRLNYIDETIQSIFKQTFPFDQIYLSVPIQISARYNLTSLSPTIISEIQEKYKRTKLKVFESVDYGPSTKLLGILNKERSPETIIVTIDDDTIYHSQVIEHFVNTLLHLTTKSSVAVVCETVSKLREKWQWVVSDVHNDYCKHGYLAAYAGAAYRRKYFDESIFYYKSAPRGCIVHDDVYISGYLRRKSIYPFIITPLPRSSEYPWSVIKHKRPTNLTVGGSQNLHKHQMDCIRHYNYFQ